MTRNRLVMCVAAAALLLTAACAHLCIAPAKDNSMGFHYYLPRPYLLVSQDTARIVWLPDMNRQYAVAPKCGIGGTLNFNLTLENGWKLTGVNSVVDTKATETIGAVGSVLASAVAAAIGLAVPSKNVGTNMKTESIPTQKPTVSAPSKPIQFYRMVYDSTNSWVTDVVPILGLIRDSMPKDTTHK